MIIVAGHIRFDPEKSEEAIAAASEMMDETAKEDGCITYVFSTSLREPGLFHIYEEWETLASLDAHGETAHMAAFRSKLGDCGVTERSVNRYGAADKTAL